MKKCRGIDKSQLKFGTRGKIQDAKYLRSYKDRVCLASRNGTDLCGNPAIGAHVRAGEYAGMGTKSSDDLVYPLCHKCHTLQHSMPEETFWIEYCFKPQLRRAYQDWKRGEI